MSPHKRPVRDSAPGHGGARDAWTPTLAPSSISDPAAQERLRRHSRITAIVHDLQTTSLLAPRRADTAPCAQGTASGSPSTWRLAPRPRASSSSVWGSSPDMLDDYGDQLDEGGRYYLERVRAAA
jgi:hypothetical protein